MARTATGSQREEVPAKPGRPSKLTEETVNAFRQAILGTHTIQEAAILAGIDDSTAMRWMARGKRARAGEYREFYEAIERAKVQAKALFTARVTSEGRKDAKMALKILERRYPEEWGVRRQIDFKDKTPPGKRGDLVRDKLIGQLDRIEERLSKPNPLDAVLNEPDES
jgi:hypothetical protein